MFLKRVLVYCLSPLLVLILLNCSQEKSEEAKVLARINDHDLTLDTFKCALAEECELNPELKLTNETKKEFLEEIIGKELLIQEAKRLKLDRKEKFIRTIERYWESTLIRDLMDEKSAEFAEKVYVSENEIESRYKEMSNTDKNLPPLEEIREALVQELKEKKETETLKQWINDLRRNSDIKIHEELL